MLGACGAGRQGPKSHLRLRLRPRPDRGRLHHHDHARAPEGMLLCLRSGTAGCWRRRPLLPRRQRWRPDLVSTPVSGLTCRPAATRTCPALASG